MKLDLKDLIKGNFYHCYNGGIIQYYFKYKYHDDIKIYCYDYFIETDTEKNNHKVYENTIWFCNMDFHKKCVVFKECLFSELIKYLPSNHPDVRNYKIKYLLSII